MNKFNENNQKFIFPQNHDMDISLPFHHHFDILLSLPDHEVS